MRQLATFMFAIASYFRKKKLKTRTRAHIEKLRRVFVLARFIDVGEVDFLIIFVIY